MIQVTKFARVVSAVLALTLAPLIVACAAQAQTVAAQNIQHQEREGAGFMAGTWVITGSYADGDPSVNFTAAFSADGTFIDRDNYRGRWIISGSSFTMYYPDESQLGYVGVITGGTIAGRFDGLSTAGRFQMRRQ